MSLIEPEVLWEEATDLAQDLVESGSDKDAVVSSVAEFLDSVIPLDQIVPGLPGVFLEAADEDFFEMVLGALKKLFEVDPEKQAERKAKRAERKAARLLRRAERKAARKARNVSR